MKNRIFIIVLSLLVYSSSFAFEKVGTTSFQFLKILPGARGASLGYTAGSFLNNSDAIFYNPAGLSRVGGLDVSVSYIDMFLDVNHYAFAGAYNVDRLGVFGLQIMYADYGTIEETRVDNLGFVGSVYNPGLTGVTFKPNAFVIGLSYAIDLTDKLSMGVSAKYVRENLIYNKTGAVAFDGGLIFNTGFRSIKIETSIRHFGPEIKYIEKSFPLPQTFTIGTSANLIATEEGLLTNLKNQTLTLAYNLVQPRDYDQMHNIGLEYNYNDFVYLRGGYQFHSDQESYSGGIGVNYNNIRFDYSYNRYGEFLPSVHRLTLGFGLN